MSVSVLPLLPGAAVDMFSAPSEKTVMFLNAPLRRKTAALSGLSDEPAGPAAGEEFCRVGSLPAQRKFRNTPFFEARAENIPTAAPGRRDRTETDTETETGSL